VRCDFSATQLGPERAAEGPVAADQEQRAHRAGRCRYATRFVGWILGITSTLTPDSPLPADGIPLSVPLIAFDKSEVRLAFVRSHALVAPGLDESFPNQG
jgi:hypothetical protein